VATSEPVDQPSPSSPAEISGATGDLAEIFGHWHKRLLHLLGGRQYDDFIGCSGRQTIFQPRWNLIRVPEDQRKNFQEVLHGILHLGGYNGRPAS